VAEPRPEKVAAVEELERRLRGSEVVILTDYRGLTVDEIGALRARLRDLKVEYRVAKNTLLGIAAERCGLKGLSRFLTGPTAVVFGQDDPGAPTRALQEFTRQYRKLEIKGGIVSGEMLDARAVGALATMPSRAELLARVVGMVQAPLRMVVSVLNSPARGLVTALEAMRAKRAEGGDAPAPAAAEPGAPAAPQPEAPADLGTAQGEAAVEPAASSSESLQQRADI
jgi:large subunit ribosomal protein L10